MNGTRESLIHTVMRETLDQERRDFLGPAMTKEELVKKHTVQGVFLDRRHVASTMLTEQE